MVGSFSRRRFVATLLAFAAVGPLASCAPAAAPTPTPAPAKPAEEAKPGAQMPTPTPAPAKPAQPTPTATIAPVEGARVVLSFWSRFEFLKEATNNYNLGPGKEKKVQVNFTTVPYAQFVEKLGAAVATKTAPDLCSIDLIQCPYFNSIGAFLDITQDVNALPYRNDLSKIMLELGTYQGKIYQVPFSSDNSALFYNKKLIEKAGLDPEKGPVTWDDYVKYAKQATKAPDQYGTAYASTSGGAFMFLFMPFVWSNGGDILSKDGKEVLINSPEAEEALKLWVDMIHVHGATPKDTWRWEWNDVVAAGKAQKIAMWLYGNWGVAQFKKEAPEIDFNVVLIPRPNKPNAKHASFAGGDNAGILAQTKYRQESWDVIQFLMSEAVQIEFLAKSGIIPIRESFFDNKYFREDRRYLVFTEALKVGRAPWTPKYNRLYDPLQTNIQAALAGRKTPKQALTDLETALKKILAE